MRYRDQKIFQLFLEVYDDRADARLDDTLEEPLRSARSLPHRLSLFDT